MKSGLRQNRCIQLSFSMIVVYLFFFIYHSFARVSVFRLLTNERRTRTRRDPEQPRAVSLGLELNSESLRVWLVLLDGGPSKFIRVIFGGSWRTVSLLPAPHPSMVASKELSPCMFEQDAIQVSHRPKPFAFSFSFFFFPSSKETNRSRRRLHKFNRPAMLVLTCYWTSGQV